MSEIRNDKKVQLEGCYHYENITPQDTNELGNKTRGILLESDGSIALRCPKTGETVVIPNLAGGILHPIQTNLILDTGTTATSVFVTY